MYGPREDMVSCHRVFLGPGLHRAHGILGGFLFSRVPFEFNDIHRNYSSFALEISLMTAATLISLLSSGTDLIGLLQPS